jgi:hypothetical protein
MTEINSQVSLYQTIFGISKSTATYQLKEIEKGMEPPPQPPPPPSVIVNISQAGLAKSQGV